MVTSVSDPFGTVTIIDSVQPRAPQIRVFSIDVLRGVALFGVLAVNIYDWLDQADGMADLAVQTATAFVLENKVGPLRRMILLYGFGIVLIELLAGNPVLVRYALLGALRSPRSTTRS